MKRLLQYIYPYRFRMALGLTVKLGATLMDLVLPYILAHLIDEVVPLGDKGVIYLWGAIMIGCALISWGANITANRMASRVARDTTERIRHDLFEKMLNLSCRQTDRLGSASLISRLTSDTYNLHRVLGMMQRLGVRAPILLLGGIGVTIVLDFRLSLVLIATLPVIGCAIVWISRRGIPLFTKVQQAGDRMVRVVRDTLTGIRVIKALSKTEYEKERFAGVNQQVVDAEMHANKVMAVTNPLMNLLLNLGLTGVIIAGAYLVEAQLSEPGKIIAFLSYFTIILNAMLSINRMFMMFSRATASANRVMEVLEMPDEVLPESLKIPTETAHIIFEDVTFSYHDGAQPALERITFSVKRGETLGIIGATGSGKSTLIQLLQGFYPVSEGLIAIDGQPIGNMTPEELHGRFGVAFQNDAFFADTIRANIDFGRGLPEEQIRLAARCAQAEAFISEKPEGFDYMLTAKATNLSGGQKQRLLIARALAGNPDILILDDSSSALDYQTDAQMRRAVHDCFPQTTTVLIAQRVSSVRQADQILVLDEGRMVGLGTHEVLQKACDVYRETSQIQMGGVADAAT